MANNRNLEQKQIGANQTEAARMYITGEVIYENEEKGYISAKAGQAIADSYGLNFIEVDASTGFNCDKLLSLVEQAISGNQIEV